MTESRWPNEYDQNFWTGMTGLNAWAELKNLELEWSIVTMVVKNSLAIYCEDIHEKKYIHNVLPSHGDQPSNMTCLAHAGILYEITINKVIIMCNIV